ncbi:MAG TPA: YncE family protein [Gaiellaceae bacterium]|nr:YncE family protein [Gaiellaceae bacterium]
MPALGRVYATATDSGELLTIAARTLKVIARAPAGEYPDGIAWAPDHRRIYVSDETGGIESVFTAAGHRVRTIRLGGEAGNVQYDPGSKHILVDVQTRNVLAVIDPRTERVIRDVAMPPTCAHPHGLLVDGQRRLVFIASDGNATLLTLDLNGMKVIGITSVGDGPDVLAFDAPLHRLYVASESGVVAVFAEQAHALTKLGQALLAPEAHVVAADPSTRLVYFPLQSQPELRVMKPTR